MPRSRARASGSPTGKPVAPSTTPVRRNPEREPPAKAGARVEGSRNSAMLTRLVITRREPFANGQEFPVTGAYEKLVGKIYGEVDPKNRLNKIIVNLGKAPRNRRGRVEYSGDFCILKPVDMARGNGKIFYDAGNGFLMRQGYTVVWCGWQGDLMPANDWLVLNVPVATNGGKPIVSKVR